MNRAFNWFCTSENAYWLVVAAGFGIAIYAGLHADALPWARLPHVLGR